MGLPHASLIAEESRANLAIDIPSHVMPKKVVNQTINTTQRTDNTVVHTEGSGELNIAASLADCGDGIAIGVELVGSGVGTVSVQRGRLKIVAQADTRLHGQQNIILGNSGVHATTPNVTVETYLCPQQICFCSKIGAVSRLGAKIGESIFQKRKTEFEARANREAKEKLSSELTAKVKDASTKFSGDTDKKRLELQDNFGVSIVALSSESGTVGRAHFNVTSQQSEPLQSGSLTGAMQRDIAPVPAVSEDGRIAIHLSEDCLSQLADCLAHRKISEMEFGEMFFEQIGFMTEYSFDSAVPTVPSEVTIAGSQPIRIKIEDDLVEVAVKVQSFSNEAGIDVQDSALIIGKYSVQMDGELLRLVRVADPKALAEHARNQERLDHIAEHFLPSRAVFTGLNFLSLLLSDVETDPAVLRVSRGWLSMATDAKLDPQFFTNSIRP